MITQDVTKKVVNDVVKNAVTQFILMVVEAKALLFYLNNKTSETNMLTDKNLETFLDAVKVIREITDKFDDMESLLQLAIGFKNEEM